MADGLRYLAAWAAPATRAALILAALATAHCGPTGAGPDPRGPDPLGASTAAVPGAEAAQAPAPWRSCLLDGASPCISAAPVRLDRELLAWSDWIAEYTATHGHAHALGVTECRWVAELDQVLLCGSYDRLTMNPPLTRAAIFVEVRAHTVVGRDDLLYLRYGAQIGGFDLLKDHPDPARPDLLHYYAALDRACAANAAMCPDEPERAMRALLERAWAGKPKFVLVTFAHVNGISDDEVVSHEILHAQYFTSPAYKEAIEAYWKGLTDAQRAEIRASLAAFYNANDEELMQNEFQAYVLMSGGERARLRRFVAEHRAPMLEMLAARGASPVVVQRRE